MDFLRLHLPGLHQALRGALDSLSTFVSYLMGDEVPIAGRREARAAEGPGEAAAGKPGTGVEEEAQEALEGLGSGQSKGEGEAGGPEEAGRCQERNSAVEQTWGHREGRCHGSQADRLDAGAWEVAKAPGCQKLSAPLKVLKDSEAESAAECDWNSHGQKSQVSSEQEVKRGETRRTWEEEEVRMREPGLAGGVESEWTWHRKPEGKVVADGQKVPGEDPETNQAGSGTVVEENQALGVTGAGREEAVTCGQNTGTQEAREPCAEGEDWVISGRQETRTTSGEEEGRATPDREETRTTSGGEEDEATSGEEETDTASYREETRTVSGVEEACTASGGEEGREISGEEEGRATLGGEEFGTTSGGQKTEATSGEEEVGTTSYREETRTVSGIEEACTASDGEEGRETSGEEEAEGEEAGTASYRAEAWAVSGIEEACTASGGEEAEETSGEEEAGTTLSREEAWTVSGAEEGWIASGPREETETTSEREEVWIATDIQEDRMTSRGEEDEATSGEEDSGTTSYRAEAQTTSGMEAAWTTSVIEEARITSGREEVCPALGSEERWINSGRKESETTSHREEAGTTSAGEKAHTTSREEEAGFPGVREQEDEKAPEEGSSEGEPRGEQEEQDEEEEEAEGSQSDKQSQLLGFEAVEGAQVLWVGSEGSGRPGRAGEGEEGIQSPPDSEVTAAGAREKVTVQAVGAEEAKQEREGSRPAEPTQPHSQEASETDREAGVQAAPGERTEVEAWAEQQMLPETPENQTPEVVRGEGVGELQRGLETQRRLEEHARPTGYVGPDSSQEGVWGGLRTGDMERGCALEDKADAEGRRALGAEWDGGLGFAPAETPEAGGKGEKATAVRYRAEEEQAPPAENPELGGRQGTGAGPAQPWREIVAPEARDETLEAEVPQGADWELGESLSSQDTPARGTLTAQAQEGRMALGQRAAGAGVWGSCGGDEPAGREDPSGGERSRGAWGEKRGERRQVEGSTEEELGGEGDPMGTLEPVGAVMAEGNGEGPAAGVEAQRPLLTMPKAGGWPAGVQGQSTEEGCGSPPHESQAQSALETETGACDPQDLEDVGGPADGGLRQRSEATLEPHGEAEGCAEAGEAHGCWNETLLPGSLLDVSVPRSRVLLSRNASQRRSRPSFRRTPALETQGDPPSPPLEEGDSDPQQSLLKLEEPPEPSAPTREGTPVSTRRRPLGHGFGLAHSGMMQELQARLGQPKP